MPHVPCKASMVAIKDSLSPAASVIIEICVIKLDKRVFKLLVSAVLLMKLLDENFIGGQDAMNKWFA
jgi:hypothetical protein